MASTKKKHDVEEVILWLPMLPSKKLLQFTKLANFHSWIVFTQLIATNTKAVHYDFAPLTVGPTVWDNFKVKDTTHVWLLAAVRYYFSKHMKKKFKQRQVFMLNGLIFEFLSQGLGFLEWKQFFRKLHFFTLQGD